MEEIIKTKNTNGRPIVFHFMKKVLIVEDYEYIPYKMIRYVYKNGDEIYIHLHGDDEPQKYNVSAADCEKVIIILNKYIKKYWSSSKDNNMIQLGRQ